MKNRPIDVNVARGLIGPDDITVLLADGKYTEARIKMMALLKEELGHEAGQYQQSAWQHAMLFDLDTVLETVFERMDLNGFIGSYCFRSDWNNSDTLLTFEEELGLMLMISHTELADVVEELTGLNRDLLLKPTWPVLSCWPGNDHNQYREEAAYV